MLNPDEMPHSVIVNRGYFLSRFLHQKQTTTSEACLSVCGCNTKNCRRLAGLPFLAPKGSNAWRNSDAGRYVKIGSGGFDIDHLFIIQLVYIKEKKN